MKERITLLVLLLTLVNIPSFSQLDKSVRFGLHGGVTVSDFSGTDVSQNIAKPGYMIGMEFDIALPSNFFVNTGLDVHLKGAKLKDKVMIETTKKVLGGDVKYNAYYLQLPLHLGYNIRISDCLNLKLSAGPYLAMGIGGKYKNTITYSVINNEKEYVYEDSSREKTFGDSRDQLRKFDAGLGCKAALDSHHFNFFMGYDKGLTNPNRYANIKNSSFYAGLGYKF